MLFFFSRRCYFSAHSGIAFIVRARHTNLQSIKNDPSRASSPHNTPLKKIRTQNGESPPNLVVSKRLLEPSPGPKKCDQHQIAHVIQVMSVAIAGTPVKHSGCQRMIGRAENSFRRRRQLPRLLPPISFRSYLYSFLVRWQWIRAWRDYASRR